MNSGESIEQLVAVIRKRREDVGPLVAEDGEHPMVWPDGTPVAFEFAVIELLMEIRDLLRREAG